MPYPISGSLTVPSPAVTALGLPWNGASGVARPALDLAVAAGGEHVKCDAPQTWARSTVAAEHGAADRREILDRTTIVLIKRDQLAVEHPARAEHFKRRQQLEQRLGQCWCHATTTPGTPIGPVSTRTGKSRYSLRLNA